VSVGHADIVGHAQSFASLPDWAQSHTKSFGFFQFAAGELHVVLRQVRGLSSGWTTPITRHWNPSVGVVPERVPPNSMELLHMPIEIMTILPLVLSGSPVSLFLGTMPLGSVVRLRPMALYAFGRWFQPPG